MASHSLTRRELLAATPAVLAIATGLLPVAAWAEQVQKQWASCAKCKTVFFDGYRNKAVCAAGGGHVAGPTRVQLPYDKPLGPRVQGAWRFCDKCHGLFFDGYPDKGVCPAGGGHHAQGFLFTLMHDIPGGGGRFRYCDKCHVLFERAPGGRCPAGDDHLAQGFMFMLLPEGSQRID